MNGFQRFMRRAFKRPPADDLVTWQGTCAQEDKKVRGHVPGQTHPRCKRQCPSCVIWNAHATQ